jgi:L-glyceraldehyde 3-phosphate reductase
MVLRSPVITSALIGASKIEQVEDAIGALNNLSFTDNELKSIDKILLK